MPQRRVLIASANPWSFALAAERAICRVHAADSVDVVNLFRLCGLHAPEWRAIDKRIEQINRKFERFLLPLASGRDVTSSVRLDRAAVPSTPASLGGLREYAVEGARIGLGVLSSVTSLTTVHDPASPAEYGRAFPAAWRTAHLSLQVGRQLAQRGYDAVYIFNGRHAYARPFCDALEVDARVRRYEQGASGNSYITADESIHHPRTTARLIEEHEYSAEAGAQFYRDRIARAPGDAVNFFTAAQVAGRLPPDAVPGGFVTFYTSSSDEMHAITDDIGFGSFATQHDAALALLDATRRRGKRLVIRFHPHLQHKHPSWRREWDFDSLRRLGAILVPPEDPCDSYKLAEASSAVFTCGSTVGFECSFRGIPNADFGLWVGGILGAMPAILDSADLEDFLDNPVLPPNAREQAMRYGSFARRAGTALPELDVGSHPYLARIAGRIVDPVRHAVHVARTLAGRHGAAPGVINGKVMLDPSLRLELPPATALEAAPRAAREPLRHCWD